MEGWGAARCTFSGPQIWCCETCRPKLRALGKLVSEVLVIYPLDLSIILDILNIHITVLFQYSYTYGPFGIIAIMAACF